MQRYIEQLIEDIDLQISKTRNALNNNVSDDEEFEKPELYENSEQKRIEDYIGIETSCLPPDERINEEQLRDLFPKLLELLECRKLYLDFPCELPIRIKYKLMRKKWSEEILIIESGETHIEFCSYLKESCPLPEYCDYCDRFDTEMDFSEEEFVVESADPIELVSTKEEVEQRKKEEAKRKIMNFRPPQNHIRGIYNYCDRWCERCDFTDRCSNYSLEKELESDDDRETTNEDFFSNLQATFEATLELLNEHADKMGVDLSISIGEIKNEEQGNLSNIKKHPLYRICKDYGETISNLLSHNEKKINSVLNHLEDDNLVSYQELNDAIDMLYWYKSFVLTKINKALNGMQRSEEDELQFSDFNGSSKVALISMDRSLGALSILLDYFPELQDEILDILLQLKKVILLTEETFPEARSFKRPGFDDELSK